MQPPIHLEGKVEKESFNKRYLMLKKLVIIVIICCLLPFIVSRFIPNRMSYDIEEIDKERCMVSICDSHGKIIYDAEYPKCPTVTSIGKHTMMVTMGAGNAWNSIFINEKTGQVSEAYDVIGACNEQLVVYGTYDDGQMKIIIRDIYDKDKCYKEITDTFAETAVGWYLIKDARIINNHLVHLTYYVGDWEEKSRYVFL